MYVAFDNLFTLIWNQYDRITVQETLFQSQKLLSQQIS